MDSKYILQPFVVVLGIALFFVGAVLGITWTTDVSFRDSAIAVQAIGTTSAICAGGFFAITKARMFRAFEPHLTITHVVSHRRIGESYVHITVTAKLRNSSKVHIEIKRGQFAVQQLSPTFDEDVENYYLQAFEDKTRDDLPWPTLYEYQRDFEDAKLMIEPGESHPETVEFIVSRDVRSVLLYTYFYNASYPRLAQTAEGWQAVTAYDLAPESVGASTKGDRNAFQTEKRYAT